MNIRSSFFALSLAMLASCAHVAGSGAPPNELVEEIGAREVYYDTQVVLGGCPSEEESAILAALASAVVSQGVSRIGDALKAAGNSETQTVLARRNVELNTTASLPACVVIARGWFYRNQPDHDIPAGPGQVATTSWPFYLKPGTVFPATNEDVDRKYWRLGLNLAASPDFYFLGNIDGSTDKTSYVVRPVEAMLDEPISSNTLRPSRKRSVLVALALSDAGTGVDLSKGGGATLVLGAMEPGKLIRYPDENQRCSAWLSLTKDKAGNDVSIKNFNVCPGVQDFASLDRNPFESNWFAVKFPDKPAKKPMFLQALVSETRSASKFLQFVGDVFGSTKDTLTKELQQALIPSVGEQADVADMAADDAKDTAYDNALSKAIVDLKACKSAPDDATKRVAARVSLRALVTAGRALGDGKLGSLNPDAIKTNETTATACDAQLTSVLSL